MLFIYWLMCLKSMLSSLLYISWLDKYFLIYFLAIHFSLFYFFENLLLLKIDILTTISFWTLTWIWILIYLSLLKGFLSFLFEKLFSFLVQKIVFLENSIVFFIFLYFFLIKNIIYIDGMIFTFIDFFLNFL